MSDLVIQVLPRNGRDLDILRRDLQWKYEVRESTYLARREYATGNQLADQGKFAEAIEHFREALQLKADDADVYIGLATALTSLGEYETATTIAEHAASLTNYEDATALDGLAAVYAASGRMEEAIRHAERAMGLARTAGRDSLANAIQRRLISYRRRDPN